MSNINRRDWLGGSLSAASAGAWRAALIGAGAAAAPAALPDAQRGSVRHRQRRSYVDGRYGQLHVTSTVAANGRATAPAVFCLPYSPRSGRDFDEFAALLATDRDVHCPDVPGFGGSDTPPSPPSLEEYAAALIDGIEAMGFGRRDRRIDLFGQHTGAALSIEIAYQRPQLVRRLVVVGVPMWEAAEAQRLAAQFARPRPYFEDPDFLSKAWQRDLPGLDAGLSRERMLLRFTEIMRAGMNSWWGFNAVFKYPTRERLAQLEVPLLAIALNEALGAPTREAARLPRHGRLLDWNDLPGAAMDFAAARFADATREFFDS